MVLLMNYLVLVLINVHWNYRTWDNNSYGELNIDIFSVNYMNIADERNVTLHRQYYY